LISKTGTRSCGCLKTNPNSQYKTDETFNNILRVWQGMKSRCYNPKHSNSKYYLGKDVVVCEEWKSFRPFYEWAKANGYSKGLQIDRIDVNGNYEPSNCHWITARENSNNKTNNRYYNYKGEKKTIAQWSEQMGISKKTLIDRIERGWTEDEIFLPARTKNNIRKYTGKTYTINGETKSITEWCEIIGISNATFMDRVNSGWSEDELLMGKGYRRGNENKFKYTGKTHKYNGEDVSIAELADIVGVSYATMKERISNGWDDKELLNPKGYRRKKGVK
jgi:hypothetical protein